MQINIRLRLDFGAVQKFEIHLTAYPGIGCRIYLLCVGQQGCLPVAELLGLGDAAAHDDGGEFLDALVVYAPVAADLLQVDETLGLKGEYLLKAADVILYGCTHLDDLGVGEYGGQRILESDQMRPEEEGMPA